MPRVHTTRAVNGHVAGQFACHRLAAAVPIARSLAAPMLGGFARSLSSSRNAQLGDSAHKFTWDTALRQQLEGSAIRHFPQREKAQLAQEKTALASACLLRSVALTPFGASALANADREARSSFRRFSCACLNRIASARVARASTMSGELWSRGD